VNYAYPFCTNPPCPSAPVLFDASASSGNGGISSYEWNFGDGTTGQGVTVSHTYQQAGTYMVFLKITDQGTPPLTTVASNQVTVYPQNTAPVASFSASPTSGPAPLTVHFTDTSTFNPIYWEWYLDYDNYPYGVVTDRNPIRVYDSPGTYSVKLYAAYPLMQNDTEIKYNYIIVTKPGESAQSPPLNNQVTTVTSLNNQVTNVPPTLTRRSSASVIPILGALGISAAMIAIRWRKQKYGKV
jgi:PKD repeat protein